MGMYAKLPFAVAPGMGMNAFFTYTIVLRNQVPWPLALGIVFWSGVLFLICSLTPIRARIADAIPNNLRLAAATGIGIFLTFIGLKNAGFVVSDPMTYVKLGPLNRNTVFVILGISFMVLLLRKKSPFAFLGGIGLVTALGYLDGQVHIPDLLVSKPDFESVFLKLNIRESLKLAFLPSMIAILFTDLFDSISAFMGCAQALGLKDKNGQPKNLREGLIVDAWATLCAGLFGTSAGVTVIESAAGIEVGGRSGLTSIVTALCFLPCLFLAPLAGMIPAIATAPVLILVGAMMFRTAGDLRLRNFEEFIPAFLTTVLIPLTFSITQGILWGLISHVGLYLAVGRRRELPPMLYGLAGVSVLMLLIESWK
jgi:AGZA family xanthine/uracil permease-like MFS transporter